MATTPSMVEEARNAASVGNNGAYSDRESIKDKYSNGTAIVENRVGTTQPLHNESRQGKELLCL